MRKIIILVFVLFGCIGGALKFSLIQQIDFGVPVSDTYKAINGCVQDLLFFPYAFIGGLFLFLMPKKTLKWLIEPLPSKLKNDTVKWGNIMAMWALGVFLLLEPVCKIRKEKYCGKNDYRGKVSSPFFITSSNS
ncbi:MAG: hypothetical protein CVU44_13975, partial [Chloroflexi bacterium HGW-Chloroflexi-6]